MAADWETCLYCQSPSGPQRQRNTPLIASSACKMPLLIKTENKNHFKKASKASNRLALVCVRGGVGFVDCVVFGESSEGRNP